MTQKQQPKIEWGFYAVVPRVVRTQYKNLSHAEKWLYTCLKDLCGDKGTCFRTLRSLSEETDISIGSLSTMIPHLHEEGLIHAEKKKRSPKGKEVWHITIADIWQSNHEYCSKIEQATQDVHFLNKDVQKLNEPTPDRSEIEPHCSNFVDRRITHKNNSIEEYKDEEQESVNVSQSSTASSHDEDAHALSSPSCSLCSEQEDIQPCQECGTRLCFEHRRDFPSETEPTRILCVTCLQRHNREMVEQRSASADSASVTVLAPTAKAEPLIASTTEPDKPKRTKKASSKPALPIEEVALRKEVQTWVDKERGYSLRGRAPKEQIFAEAAATETLAHMLYVRKVEGNVQEGCEWADLVYVRTYCAKQDKYWSKPENRARLGSYAVLQQFNVALALRQTEVPQNMTSLHVVGGRQETPLQRRNREMREKYENPVAKREAVTHGA